MRHVQRGGDRERRDLHALHAAVALQFFFKVEVAEYGIRRPVLEAAPAQEFVQRAVRLGAISENHGLDPSEPRL